MSKLLGARCRALVLLSAVLLALSALPARAETCSLSDPVVTEDPASSVRIPAILAVDEAWQEAYGGEGERAADRLIDDVNDILRPAGVNLAVAGRVAWTGNGERESMAGMLEQLEDSVPAQSGRLVIGLTGRRFGRVDSVARVGKSHLVARLHPISPERDAPVVAHEVGHVLGAGHDTCCRQSVMAPESSLRSTEWCPRDARQVYAGAARVLAE